MRHLLFCLLLAGCLRPAITELQINRNVVNTADTLTSDWLHKKNQECIDLAKKSIDKAQVYLTCSQSAFDTATKISNLIFLVRKFERDEAEVILNIAKGQAPKEDLDEARKRVISFTADLQAALKEIK